MVELVRAEEGTHGETSTSNRMPAGGDGFMLVDEDVAEGSKRGHLHSSVEGVTVRELGFIEAVLSIKRDAGFSKEKLS